MLRKSKIFIAKLIGEDSVNLINYFFSFIYYNRFKEYKNKRKIIYLLTPQHGNIGDQAIAIATIKFLREKFSDYDILEISDSDTYKYTKAIKSILRKDDLVILHGGGNMGNLYVQEEVNRRFVIEKFKYNKIISMTQTISFTKDDEGISELNKTKKIYNSHNDLTIIAREEESYKIMKKELKNNKILMNPDIVLYLHDIHNEFKNTNRINIMTCLRKDKESLLDEKRKKFIGKIDEKYENTFHYDTVVERGVTEKTREYEVNDMLNKFVKAKVVITDRLHGMIFCVITKTPCIVTKSLDHKVPGTYRWIKDLNYIKIVENLDSDNIDKIINEFLHLDKINDLNFKSIYFDELREKVV